MFVFLLFLSRRRGGERRRKKKLLNMGLRLSRLRRVFFFFFLARFCPAEGFFIFYLSFVYMEGEEGGWTFYLWLFYPVMVAYRYSVLTTLLQVLKLLWRLFCCVHISSRSFPVWASALKASEWGLVVYIRQPLFLLFFELWLDVYKLVRCTFERRVVICDCRPQVAGRIYVCT